MKQSALANWSLLIAFALLISFAPKNVLAQSPEAEEAEPFFRHKFAYVAGYTWTPQGRNEITDERQTIIAPVVGLDYEFWFSERWGIGTFNELEIINIRIERNSGDFLRRENVVVLSAGPLFQILPRWSASAAIGAEIDTHATLLVLRLGTEYAFIESGPWEVAVSFDFINKEIYDNFGLGLVVAYRLK
ncbi:hypothetical protein [Pontibacter sp. G13]|uniref:hypothetical protein n=1 Tax=Pontibacter sp. G13 TaxID=3074898 RepID=UPI00288C2712|nr:hypothetical protein [Pontibacter sp. G13]WNJ18646.1 hypothetical protein RJD25_27640 [Pontibacter sp. G13]